MPSGKRFWIFALFAFLAVVYWLNRSPFVSFHDSLSFLLDAESGFNLATNATSHFLYLNFLRFLFLMLPGLDHVGVFTGVSIISSLSALIVFRKLAEDFSGNWMASVLSTIGLGLSFSWWQQSEIIEVYSFNSFWVCCWLFLVFKDVQERVNRRMPLAFLFWGISILVHIQNVLGFPLFAWYFLRSESKISAKLISVALFISLSSLLFILPLFTHSNSFSAIFFDRNFGNQFQDFGFLSLLKGLMLSIAFLGYNWHILLIPVLVGLYYLKDEKREIRYFLTLVIAPWVVFGLKFQVQDSHVFFITVWMMVGLILSKGISEFLKPGVRWFPIVFILFCMASPVIYFSSARISKSSNQFKTYEQEKSYKGGTNHIFWPGKADAKDPLKLCTEIIQSGDSVEWEFRTAGLIVEQRKKRMGQ